MKPNRAASLGVKTLDDLAGKAPDLTLGSDLEFPSGPVWGSLKSAYGFQFRTTRSYTPTFMYHALSSGDADVISAFSSDGRIAADHLVVLSDPKGAIPSYDAVVLLAPKRANDKRLIGALRPLIGKITVERMREANLTVDRDTDKRSPEDAAKALTATIP